MTSGAGILPIAKYNGKYYMLCGINGKGELTDLGGKISYKGELSFVCATREFYEETAGSYMEYNKLYTDLRLIRKVYIGFGYVSYIVLSHYDPKVEMRYADMLQHVMENNIRSKDVDTTKYKFTKYKTYYPKGFFEMRALKWIPINELINNKIGNRLKRILYIIKII